MRWSTYLSKNPFAVLSTKVVYKIQFQTAYVKSFCNKKDQSICKSGG
jgi:hypothetical protein